MAGDEKKAGGENGGKRTVEEKWQKMRQVREMDEKKAGGKMNEKGRKRDQLHGR